MRMIGVPKHVPFNTISIRHALNAGWKRIFVFRWLLVDWNVNDMTRKLSIVRRSHRISANIVTTISRKGFFALSCIIYSRFPPPPRFLFTFFSFISLRFSLWALSSLCVCFCMPIIDVCALFRAKKQQVGHYQRKFFNLNILCHSPFGYNRRDRGSGFLLIFTCGHLRMLAYAFLGVAGRWKLNINMKSMMGKTYSSTAFCMQMANRRRFTCTNHLGRQRKSTHHTNKSTQLPIPFVICTKR